MIDATPFIVAALVGSIPTGYLLFGIIKGKFLKQKIEDFEFEEDIPRDRQPIIEFSGDEIIGSFEGAKGQYFSGRAYRRRKIHDCLTYWIADDQRRKNIKLDDLVLGVNLKPHPAADLGGGKVKLITNKDATNEQCSWSSNGLELQRKQLDAVYAEKSRQEVEKHAREIKEFQNRLRSPSALAEEELLSLERKIKGEEK